MYDYTKRRDPFAELIAKQKYRKEQYDAKKKAEEERKNANFFERVGHTLGDFLGTVAGGVSQGIEGIIDFAAGTVGTIGGWFGNEGMKRGAERFIANDWTGDHITRPLAEATKSSYINDMGESGQNIVRGVASGVGQMLPSIGVSAVPGGQAAGMGAFMAGAGGGSAQQALSEGASLDKAMAYGTMSGLMEGGVEMLTAGLGGTRAGRVLGRQLGKTAGGKLATTFVGEGMEEVLSDLIDPALKRMTYDKDATVDWKRLPETFAVGGLTGMALGGAEKAITGIAARETGGLKAVNAEEALSTYRDIGADANKRAAEGKAVNDALFDSQREAYLAKAEKQLAKMKPQQRAAFLKKYDLADTFDANGRSLAERGPQPVYNAEAYTPSLRGREGQLSYRPTKAALTGAQREAVNNVIKLKNGQVDVVITDSLAKGENGAYRDGVLYISDKASAPAVVAAHELTHTLEGTKEYEALYKHIAENMPDLAARLKTYRRRYARSRKENGIKANYSEETLNYEARTELVADYVGELMSRPDAVARVVTRDRNLAVRLYDWIKDKIKALAGKGESMKTLAYYRKAEKLYAQALRTGSEGVPLSEVERQFYLRDTWNGLDKYSESEIRSMESNEKIKVAYHYEDIKSFLVNAEQQKNDRFLFLGKIKAKAADYVKRTAGIDVQGKSIVLNSKDATRIFGQRRSKKAKRPRNQIAVTKANMENIIGTILSPDTVSKRLERGNVVKVIFKKTIDGKNVVVTILYSKNALSIKSAYINKSDTFPPRQMTSSLPPRPKR